MGVGGVGVRGMGCGVGVGGEERRREKTQRWGDHRGRESREKKVVNTMVDRMREWGGRAQGILGEAWTWKTRKERRWECKGEERKREYKGKGRVGWWRVYIEVKRRGWGRERRKRNEDTGKTERGKVKRRGGQWEGKELWKKHENGEKQGGGLEVGKRKSGAGGGEREGTIENGGGESG